MRPLFIQILNRFRSECNVIPYRPRTLFRLYWRDILRLSINTYTTTFFHTFFIQIPKLSNFTIISNGILYVCGLEYGLSFIKTLSVYTSCKTEKVSNHNFQIVIESPIQSFLIVVPSRSHHLKNVFNWRIEWTFPRLLQKRYFQINRVMMCIPQPHYSPSYLALTWEV